LPPMPMASIFGRRSSLPTVLKAALRSKPITATTLDLAETQATCAVASTVVQEQPFLKPCCKGWGGRMFLALMKASRSSLAIVSSTLDMAHRIATGLYKAGECLALPPPLYTGWISAVLKADGKMPADSDMLTRVEMGPAKTSDPILRMATGIPLVPSADVDLSPVMTFAILPAFAKLKEKVEGIFPRVSPPPEVVALS
jgi:hypothetical protein